MKLFVTVGTTSFNDLIKVIGSNEAYGVLKYLGYTEAVLQVGRGTVEPEECWVPGFTVSFYRYKASITEDLASADLVISHAGAGSVLESLRIGARLLVVINDSLMDNHQAELASVMQDGRHCLMTTCSGLPGRLKDMVNREFTSLPPGQPERLSALIVSLLDKERT